MIPIQELLNRIRWDEEFGRGEFAIGYYDRVKDQILILPLQAISFGKESHFAFEFIDSEGVIHSVPLHRIRSVFKNGSLIWHREA